jgi:glycosyltransferase involved in cell wall biosynthesis
MKILLSAFACDPALGSEAAVGWSWASELARQGHEVSVLTRFRYQASIESAMAQSPIPNLRFIYFDLKHFPYKIPLFGVYAYYALWQFKLWLLADQLFDYRELDCIQHLTYASCRTLFFLAYLPVPSIFGPVGGGETAPMSLHAGMSLPGKAHECLRLFVNFLWSRFPITELLWRQPTLNLVTTEETLRMVPMRYRRKTRVLPAIASPPVLNQAWSSQKQRGPVFRMLYVGRLLDWKGVHLAIQALSLALHATSNLSLTILGEGRNEGRLRSLVQRLHLEKSITFLPQVSRAQVIQQYDEHDVLLMPSLHDSGGTVVLEAMSRSLPVICLKLGGPGLLVDSTCGVAIDPQGLSAGQVIESLAFNMMTFSRMPPEERQALEQGALRRARNFEITEVVRRAYGFFEEVRNQGVLDSRATEQSLQLKPPDLTSHNNA